MPYCIYLRKSRTDAEAEQRGEGETLARHETILLELARKLNLDVTNIYKELVSGDTIASRPVMQKMLNEIGQGTWEGVIVMEIERLARGDTIDQGIVAQAFKLTDTKIVTPSKIYNPNDEFDEEYFEFGLFMSRREYKAIRRRMARGREAAVREGKYIGTYPPYGYKKIYAGKDCTLEINPEQAQIVKLIYELYTKGEKQSENTSVRLGYNAIAIKLNDMRVPTMRGTLWIASTVKAILKNPIYIGKVRWHHKKVVKKIIDGEVKSETVTSKEGDYILADGLHEPIIDMETWNNAQYYVRQIPTAPAPISRGVKNPFAGLIVCGVCGKKMYRKPHAGKPDLLICTTHGCTNKGAYFRQVESEILSSLQKWMNEYKMENEVREESGNTNLQLNLKESGVAELKEEISVLKGQLDKTHVLLEQGVYSVETFLERSHKIKDDISILNKNVSSLEKEIDDIRALQTNRQVIIPKIESVLYAYDKLRDAGEKNKMMKEILTKVIYSREKRNYKNGVDNKFEIKIFPKIL